ncbi:MAG: LuxR C-terminal-related transcriptional regulator [Paraglaciecola sp.]|uniref:helix-turn-helix transcriptional regulator n=1 Tax=Paraglaciecola sp. TaxID=1920173 RepID=UPI0032634CDE
MNKTFDLERTLVSLTLILVFFSALFDYLEDASEGASYIDLFFDTFLNAFVIGTLLYIWRKRPSATHSRNQHLEKVLKKSDKDLKAWQDKASDLLRGLGEKINEQLSEWRLSQAEKEVALFLIKGLSTREIAFYRETSEKTVRQQASQVYAKANLDNRAELAAFFLEDLLLP